MSRGHPRYPGNLKGAAMNHHGHLIAFPSQRKKMTDIITNPQNGVIFTVG